MRVGVAMVTAMTAVLVAGCGPEATVTPTPSPSPTFMCTPEAGGTEAPCSEQDYQEMKAKDALYAEAEQVYRTYQAEFLKVIRAGGADELTPGLESVSGVTDDFDSFRRSQNIRQQLPHDGGVVHDQDTQFGVVAHGSMAGRKESTHTRMAVDFTGS